jgi:hypothetical protein
MHVACSELAWQLESPMIILSDICVSLAPSAWMVLGGRFGQEQHLPHVTSQACILFKGCDPTAPLRHRLTSRNSSADAMLRRSSHYESRSAGFRRPRFSTRKTTANPEQIRCPRTRNLDGRCDPTEPVSSGILGWPLGNWRNAGSVRGAGQRRSNAGVDPKQLKAEPPFGRLAVRRVLRFYDCMHARATRI